MSSSLVIAIDGPSGSGKGTVGQLLAEALGWHFLDSGALYRLLALTATQQGIAIDDEDRLAQLATQVNPASDPCLTGNQTIWPGQTLTAAIRTEACAQQASRLGVYPKVRQALLACQRRFRRAPGLVADGRDMGSVVFPDAALKIFLQASIEQRAQRRHLQLKAQGITANLEELCRMLKQRDHDDQHRPMAALKPTADAWVIDTTHLTVEQVLAAIKQILDQNLD